MANGLIDRAFLSGSHDPATYYRKFPRSTWNERGGYQIQTTPNEVAAIITESRAWVRGHRMLCVGTGTLGAERFIAENLKMLEVDYIGDALEANAKAISAKKVSEPSGRYDVITLFGTAKVEAILRFTKIGTLVVFIGVGPQAKNPALRTAWLGIRKKHMTMLQTGGEAWQTGVGIMKILFVEGQNAVNNSTTESKQPDEAESQKDAKADEAPEPAGVRESSHVLDDGGGDSGAVSGQAKGVGAPDKTAVKWSRSFDKCQGCGTVEVEHVAKGLCKTCYPKRK